MEDKSDKITINKIINSWFNITTKKRVIFLIGYSHTGRTTFAELIKKYQFGDSSDGLTFDAGKYNLEGVISPKAIKIQTTAPVIYAKDSKDDQQLGILDVPSYNLAPQTKKWTALEQKLTQNYMFQKYKNVGFLLFVQQKNTKSNINPWKKPLLSFLQTFKLSEFSDELLDSIAMIVTKTPPDIKQDTMVKRLKMMQNNLEKQKAFDISVINRLFKNIIEKERFLIFKKVNCDEAEKEEILANWEKLKKLPNYSIKKEHVKDFNWTADEEKSLTNYLQLSESYLVYLSQTLKKVIQLKEFTFDNIRAIKRQHRPEKPIIEIGEQVKAKMTPGSFSPLQFVQHYVTFEANFNSINEDNIDKLVQQILEFNIFNQVEDQFIFQIILEAIDFKKSFGFIERYYQLQNFQKDLFSESLKLQVFEKLLYAETGNEGREFYETVIKLIDQNFKEIPQSLKEFYETAKINKIKFSDPKEALKFALTSLNKEKNKAKIFQYTELIGEVFYNAKLFEQAFLIYKLSKNPGKALRCSKEMQIGDIKKARQYIQFLVQICLFDEAKRACFDFYSKFGYNSREQLGKTLQLVTEHQKSYLRGNGTDNVLLQQITQKGIQQIIRVAQTAMSNI